MWHQFPWLRWGLGPLQGCTLRCLSYFWMFYPHFDESDINAWQNSENPPFAATLLLCDSIHGPRITKITSKQSSWDYVEYSPICLPNSLFLLLIFRLSSKLTYNHKMPALCQIHTTNWCCFTVGGMLHHLTPAGEQLASKIPEERQISAKVALSVFSQPSHSDVNCPGLCLNRSWHSEGHFTLSTCKSTFWHISS